MTPPSADPSCRQSAPADWRRTLLGRLSLISRLCRRRTCVAHRHPIEEHSTRCHRVKEIDILNLQGGKAVNRCRRLGTVVERVIIKDRTRHVGTVGDDCTFSHVGVDPCLNGRGKPSPTASVPMLHCVAALPVPLVVETTPATLNPAGNGSWSSTLIACDGPRLLITTV